MTDVAAFVRDRLDEDEQAARAVQPLGETVDMGGNRLPHRFGHSRMTFASEDGMPRREGDREAQAHFARHDPARVLAEVAALRAVVELHDAIPEEDSCSEDQDPKPCRTLLALARAWADHSDYDPAWGA